MNLLVNAIAIIIGILGLRTGGKEEKVQEEKKGLTFGKIIIIGVAFWYISKKYTESKSEDLESKAPTDITIVQAQAIHKALHPYSNPTGVDGLDYNALLQVADEVKKVDVAKVTSNYYTLFRVTLGGDLGNELSKNQVTEFYVRLNKETATAPKVVYNTGDVLFAREDLSVFKESDSTKVETTFKKGDEIGTYLKFSGKNVKTGKIYFLIDIDWSIKKGFVDASKVYKL